MISSVFQFSENQRREQQIILESERLREDNLLYLNQINRYNAQLIQKVQLASLYKTINDAATENGVNIQQIFPAIFQNDAHSDSFIVNIQFSAKFKPIIRFIHFIEENNLLLRITQLELQKKVPESLFIEGRLEITIITKIE